MNAHKNHYTKEFITVMGDVLGDIWMVAPRAFTFSTGINTTFSTGINTRDASSHTESSSTAKRRSNKLPELNNSPMNFSQRHYTSRMEDATYTPGD